MKRKSRKISSETKEKMSKAKIGSMNPMFGRKHDQKTKDLISEKMKQYWKSIV